MNYKTYRENTFKNINTFSRTFKPWLKWQNVKLSDLCPCNDCDINKELKARQYEVQMSGGLQEEIMKPCGHCIDITHWKIECLEKLKWYEDNDKRCKI